MDRNLKGETFRGFGKKRSEMPDGIVQIEITPEIKNRARNLPSVHYHELMQALFNAHKAGQGLAVDADLYWKGRKDRYVYMAIRRLGDRYGVRIKSNRKERESRGVVYLWIEPEDDNGGSHSAPRRVGRPRRQFAA